MEFLAKFKKPEKVIGVYNITYVHDDKEFVYIGSSRDIFLRWNSHYMDLRNGVHHCKKLQKLFDRFPISQRFKFNIIVTHSNYSTSLYYEYSLIGATDEELLLNTRKTPSKKELEILIKDDIQIPDSWLDSLNITDLKTTRAGKVVFNKYEMENIVTARCVQSLVDRGLLYTTNKPYEFIKDYSQEIITHINTNYVTSLKQIGYRIGLNTKTVREYLDNLNIQKVNGKFVLPQGARK